MKQLEEDMGISMEMGTIHAGDFLVGLVLIFLYLHQSERKLSVNLYSSSSLDIFISPSFLFNTLLLLQRRFCSHLNMENNEVRAATETVKKSEMLDIRSVPSSSSFLYFLSC